MFVSEAWSDNNPGELSDSGPVLQHQQKEMELHPAHYSQSKTLNLPKRKQSGLLE